MKTLGFGRHVLGIGVAVVLLAGCGGAQTGGPGALPVGTTARAKAQGYSGTLLEAKSGALVYATGGCGGACIFSYPEGKLKAKISLTFPWGGDCSDSEGNVFVTNNAQVLEYAHGGTTPIATLALPGINAAACGVDPKTGNLAVIFGGGSAGNIAIFADETGTPTLYASGISPYYCGYDDAGNLFVSGEHGYYPFYPQFAELAYGATNFSQLSISKSIGTPGQIQWDGNYITWESRTGQDMAILRLTVSGSTASVVSKTKLRGPKWAFQSWIAGNRVILPYSTHGPYTNKIGIWQYSKGGKVLVKFGDFGQSNFTQILGVTLSVAPSASHIRR